jgi:hypothetical protein
MYRSGKVSFQNINICLLVVLLFLTTFASRIVKGEWYLGGEQRNLDDSTICDALYDSSAKCQTHLKSSSGGYYEVRLSSVMTTHR